MSRQPTGLLLMAYGSPRRPEDLEAYLTHVRHGRTPSDALLQEIAQRYRAIGGASPLVAITQAQGAALEQALNAGASDRSFRLYIGYKHAAPFIEDAVANMHADGITSAVALVLAPHYSTLSIRTYIDRAIAAGKHHGGPTIEAVSSWYQQPKFVEYWAREVSATLAKVPAADLGRTAVLFSAHSLPERILKANDPYPQQLAASAGSISRAAGLHGYELAWQSAGRMPEPWLGPDVQDLTRELADTAGYQTFVYCPIGFVSDHLEVLYDNDVECRAVVEERGGHYLRARMPNTDSTFIAGLRDAVLGQLAGVGRRAA